MRTAVGFTSTLPTHYSPDGRSRTCSSRATAWSIYPLANQPHQFVSRRRPTRSSERATGLLLTSLKLPGQRTPLASPLLEDQMEMFCSTRFQRPKGAGTPSTPWCSRTSTWRYLPACHKTRASMGWANRLALLACGSCPDRAIRCGLQTLAAGTWTFPCMAAILS